ncbi:hypothetical protein BX600DRAFT_463762 [Xylariales sp. PMI_506]|nr:hypothetical protein BX600DRAFT_463762 [Xylariales sp. PMI_506]
MLNTFRCFLVVLFNPFRGGWIVFTWILVPPSALRLGRVLHIVSSCRQDPAQTKQSNKKSHYANSIRNRSSMHRRHRSA